MKPLVLLPVLLLLTACAARPSTVARPALPDFASYPVYHGPDLGLTFREGRATLRVWAPTAEALHLKLYEAGTGGTPVTDVAMQKAESGTWTYTLPPRPAGRFYVVQATIGGQKLAEVPDPYVHAVGLNGQRGALLDPAMVNPIGWPDDRRPMLAKPTDVIIGELHLRDLSMHPESGIEQKGKYAGLAEGNTRGPQGVSTGLGHLTELGISHVHLLPTNDFASIDESKLSENRYNWGYDPLHFSVPEGSYATDPADPAARIRELKQVVQALHRRGLRLVLDVVYNHATAVARTSFEQLVPGYYYRHNADGSLSNATACGNEIASERPMVRKLIVESVAYWAREYHADGFRFDLMGVLDLETMRAVRVTLDQQDHSILIYGEGWAAGTSPLPETERAVKVNVSRLDRVAAFSDELRDGVRGHYARHTEAGFASGQPGLEESVKFGIVAATEHPQLDYTKVNYSKAPWAASPAQTINYVACHDDQLLWDKLQASNPGATEAELIQRDLLSNTIVFTSQGIPFLPIGDEFLRTKGGSHNSFDQPDSVNQIDWGRKARYAPVYEFYKQLLALRRAHPAFRLPTRELIQQHLEFLPDLPPGTIAYRLRDHAGDDEWQNIVVVFNGNRTAASVVVPAGQYTMVLRGDQVVLTGIEKMPPSSTPLTLKMPPSTAMILVEP
ncbi:pullulanase, type I [Hymenobacter roseosalivarius DSM 11622]|uniref:Pullulanase, type I n=1 Tax=Hymenobacter roseosalivarius DSM 11622 TaxID=645990 RepID=A0A1W1VM68_9BACT|nr:type I pullulanase [Hymenobacter roseosalivarius]SMB94141.1 pullulanase, type I [Hymenobacter roseosalivarius DSM 11622]